MVAHDSGAAVSWLAWSLLLTNIHDGRSGHVTEGRRQKEEGVKTLAWVHTGLRSATVMTEENVESSQAAQLSQKHAYSLKEERRA